tara:strand:+ start:8364 stop:8783 length:420 start_codon:yes stop_codon:yes gene_type:complete
MSSNFDRSTFYKGQAPIEQSLISTVNRIGLLKEQASVTGNYDPYFEAISFLYDIIPPDVRRQMNETKEMKAMIKGIPDEYAEELNKMTRLDRMNAHRNLAPKFKKKNADRFFRRLMELLYDADLLLKSQNRYTSEVGYD